MSKGRFDQRRAAQGYRPPSERNGCRNCRHCKADRSPFNATDNLLHCGRGGFIVSPGGVCPEHQLAGIAAVPRKAEP
jgi:hypothetical protein